MKYDTNYTTDIRPYFVGNDNIRIEPLRIEEC